MTHTRPENRSDAQPERNSEKPGNVASIRFSHSIIDTVGRTPLVHLAAMSAHCGLNVFGKLECANPGGSLKDRSARAIIVDAVQSGRLKSGDIVVESSSGNMAIGLAQICTYYHLNLIAVVDVNANEQAVRTLRAYGASIDLVSEVGPHAGLLGARLARVQEILSANPSAFNPNQYTNELNPAAHSETIAEIDAALDGQIDVLFVATSTCGTLMGFADYISQRNLDTQLVAVDAVGSVLFGDKPGRRLLPGHGAGKRAPLLDEGVVDRIMHRSDLDCVRGCRDLLRSEAILAGASTGALVSGLYEVSAELPASANCVLIVADRGDRYLETVYEDEWVRSNWGDDALAWVDSPFDEVIRDRGGEP